MLTQKISSKEEDSEVLEKENQEEGVFCPECGEFILHREATFCCPNCGYKWTDESKLVNTLKNLFAKKKDS